jgi:phage gpG-like protein
MEPVLRLESAQWDSLLKKLFVRMRDAKPFMRTAYSTLGYKNIMTHFSDESGPDGKWAPLKYRKGAILQDTGNLRNSVLNNARDNGVNSVVVFANAKYSGFHNYGTPTIPKREFMWLDSETKQNMAKMIASLIVESL